MRGLDAASKPWNVSVVTLIKDVYIWPLVTGKHPIYIRIPDN